jgi:nucleotide-binding universal stress UspA family protein
VSAVNAPIVVGVDGSAGAESALAWAADEALRRKAPLRLVHAMDVRRYAARWQDLPPVQDHRDMSWSVLTSAIVDVEDVDIQVEPVLEVGRPVDVLLEHARQAQLLVVGSRGRSELVELLLGSISLHLAMRSPCPVVVIRPVQPRTPGPSAGRVVVGVDGSESSDSAVRFAFDEADQRGVGLTAVHAWLAPSYANGATPPRAWEVAGAEERAILAERVAGWAAKYPDLDVVCRTVHGDPASVLVAHSIGAALTVVGSHCVGGLSGLLLGSVSHAVLHHAGSPVVVVRPEGSE